MFSTFSWGWIIFWCTTSWKTDETCCIGTEFDSSADSLQSFAPRFLPLIEIFWLECPEAPCGLVWWNQSNDTIFSIRSNILSTMSSVWQYLFKNNEEMIISSFVKFLQGIALIVSVTVFTAFTVFLQSRTPVYTTFCSELMGQGLHGYIGHW